MSSMTKEGERMMAVVLGNLHPTPGSDKGARDVQFMHTFVLEHKAGDASSNGDSFEDSEFSIVDEVFRRVDPVGDSRAPGGLAAGAGGFARTDEFGTCVGVSAVVFKFRHESIRLLAVCGDGARL